MPGCNNHKYENNFYLIVCRNVVIYFNVETKDEIYSKFCKALNKDGLLFVGATESIYGYRDYGFEKASTFLYRKPLLIPIRTALSIPFLSQSLKVLGCTLSTFAASFNVYHRLTEIFGNGCILD